MRGIGSSHIMIASLVFTPIGISMAVTATAEGDGTYLAAMLLSPYTMVSTAATSVITLPSVGLAKVQCPLYGVVRAASTRTNQLRTALTAVLAGHLCALIPCMLLVGENFRW
jgi:hypothetical protein